MLEVSPAKFPQFRFCLPVQSDIHTAFCFSPTARDVSAKSLRSVLTPEKVAELLAMHTSPDDEQTSTTNQADGLEPSEPMPPIQSN